MTLSLGEIIQALGGGALFSTRFSVPGPGRSAGDRSLLIRLSPMAPDGFELESLVGDDINACRDYVRQRVGLAPFAPKANGERATREGDAAAPDGLIAPADKIRSRHHGRTTPQICAGTVQRNLIRREGGMARETNSAAPGRRGDLREIWLVQIVHRRRYRL